MADVLLAALREVLDGQTLLVILLAAAYGVFVGAMPGLTATMAVALLVPLTFFMSDVEAVAAIVATVTCSIFAGDIPAALVRIPGTPASAAYANDAYAMTRAGRHEEALGICLVFSVLGGLFGALVLATAAPLLARFARQFTSYEYFWLYVLGLTCAAIVSQQSRLKGALALLIGLLLSTVGLGTDFSTPRLTFGFDELVTGIQFIPAMIGLFGLSEVLRNVLAAGGSAAELADPEARRVKWLAVWPIVGRAIPLAWRRKWHLVRSSTLGSLIGMLPGAGADIAAWISYAISQRLSRQPQQFGMGSEEGLSDATGANNAALGSAWVPALVFGIPGDSVTAIAIGVLLMKNITPGPDIFDAAKDPHQATLVYSIFVSFVVANIVLLPLGLAAIRAGSLLVRLPRSALLPLVVLFCIVGSYAIYGSYFDVWIMLAMGLLGFVLERSGVPLGPVVLGIILGGPLEHRFIQCITKSGDVAPFFASPIRCGLALAVALLWLGPLAAGAMRRGKTSS